MYQSITMPEFEQLWKKTPVKLVDVREDDEFAHAHVDGAISMPLSGLEDTADQLDKDENYYVMCLSGARSMQLANILLQRATK
jgi:rhodanese-related sulfurtransferase